MIGRRSSDTVVAFFMSQYLGIQNYSMGTAYMTAYLRANGVNAVSVSGCTRDLLNFLEDLKKKGVRVFGIPAYDTAFSHLKMIAKEARRILPEVLIVTGGPTATFADDIIFKHVPEIDVVVGSRPVRIPVPKGEGRISSSEPFSWPVPMSGRSPVRMILSPSLKLIPFTPSRFKPPSAYL